MTRFNLSCVRVMAHLPRTKAENVCTFFGGEIVRNPATRNTYISPEQILARALINLTNYRFASRVSLDI